MFPLLAFAGMRVDFSVHGVYAWGEYAFNYDVDHEAPTWLDTRQVARAVEQQLGTRYFARSPHDVVCAVDIIA